MPHGPILAPDPRIERNPALEWPTLALAALIHGGWLALTYWHASLPWWLLLPAAAWLIAWHGSLQHEIIHGHPTRSRAINALLGSVPLALWIPYERYRQTHLAHHHDERLTDPLDDPESRYWTGEGWCALGPIGRAIVRAQSSLIGRLTIGPAWSIGRFLWTEARGIAGGDRELARIWLRHGATCAAVLVWVLAVCQMPLWQYLLCFVYAGTSLSLVRSFAEHRAAPEMTRRTAIVENARVLGLLFLYNNLHVVHHRWPTIPWYRLPAFYRANRERILAEAGGPLYRGYRDVARRFLLRAHDQPVHPAGRVPTPTLSDPCPARDTA